MLQDNKIPLTVTIKDACALTGIGRNQLEHFIKNDINFPSFKIGRKTMIHVELLNNYLANKAKARVGETTMSPRIAQIMAKRELEKSL